MPSDSLRRYVAKAGTTIVASVLVHPLCPAAQMAGSPPRRYASTNGMLDSVMQQLEMDESTYARDRVSGNRGEMSLYAVNRTQNAGSGTTSVSGLSSSRRGGSGDPGDTAGAADCVER